MFFFCLCVSICALLTFRNVALSLVTMDGLTLMLSCIIDVKLHNKTKGRKKLLKSAKQTKPKHNRVKSKIKTTAALWSS